MAALLQYFFLAAFCWMLCEGIMLYLMLVVVFSTLSKNWWFFLIIGWGKNVARRLNVIYMCIRTYFHGNRFLRNPIKQYLSWKFNFTVQYGQNTCRSNYYSGYVACMIFLKALWVRCWSDSDSDRNSAMTNICDSKLHGWRFNSNIRI